MMMTVIKRLYLYLQGMVVWLVFFMLLIATMIVDACTETGGKYHVYAAGKHYQCNHFQVSGKTIYFADTHGNNVCIVGDYTLVYERNESDTQTTKKPADREEE